MRSLILREVQNCLDGIAHSFGAGKSDGLIFLGLNGIVPTICTFLRLSPILGFILSGILLGPNGMNVFNFRNVDQLGELGILLFLFEMGLELSMSKLSSMRCEVFGLGTLQFLLTSTVFALLCSLFGFSLSTSCIIGCSLALSSSAFVIQILKDKDCLETDYGKASKGILLFQDLIVVPLLIVVQLLASTASTGQNIGAELFVSLCKFIGFGSLIGLVGATLLKNFISVVAATDNISVLMSTIASATVAMGWLTHGVGLSESLGAFSTGISLSGSTHRHKIESAIAPIRSILLSLFFVRVGCAINPLFIFKEIKILIQMLIGLVSIKFLVTAWLCSSFGKQKEVGKKCGLLNSQGGEFAFVALGLAENNGLLDSRTTQLLLTTVAISMAITPLLAEVADKIGNTSSAL